MIRDEIEKVTADQILTAEHLASLSPNAVKLYLGVWKLMAERGESTVRAKDDLVSRRGRLLLQFIPAAQSELARAGLLILLPGANETSYEYVELDDSPELS
jgi:hypothetical protein